MVQLTADNSTFPATIVIGDMATVSVCMIMNQMMAVFRFYFCIALALQTFLSGEWNVKKCFINCAGSSAEVTEQVIVGMC